jgi:hypothetical protein
MRQSRNLEFCLEGKGYPIGLLLSSQGSGFIQAMAEDNRTFLPAGFLDVSTSHRTATKTHTVWHLFRMASHPVGHLAQVTSWYQTSITPPITPPLRQAAMSKELELPL